MDPANLEESDLKGMEVCNLGGTEMALPLDLIEQVNDLLRKLFLPLMMFGSKNVCRPTRRWRSNVW